MRQTTNARRDLWGVTGGLMLTLTMFGLLAHCTTTDPSLPPVITAAVDYECTEIGGGEWDCKAVAPQGPPQCDEYPKGMEPPRCKDEIPHLTGFYADGSLSESYVWKNAQQSYAVEAQKILWIAMEALEGDGWGTIDGDSWSVKQQRVCYGDGCYDDFREWWVEFTATGYSADSNVQCSDPNVRSSPTLNEGGQAELIENNGETTDTHEIERSFTLERSEESTFSTSMTFDASLDTETSISGGYAGVSVDETLKAHFGTSFTTDKSHSESESTSKTQTFKDTVDVPAGKSYLISFSRKQVHADEDCKVNGVLDFGLRFYLPKDDSRAVKEGNDTAYPWQWGSQGDDSRVNTYFRNDGNLGWKNRKQEGGGSGYIEFGSVNDFIDFIEGTNTDWPHMDGWEAHYESYYWWQIHNGWRDKSIWAIKDKLRDNDLRSVNLAFTRTLISDDTVDYSILDVSDESCDPDDIRDAFGDDFEGSAEDKLDSIGCSHAPVN